jgi:hypothetical protein
MQRILQVLIPMEKRQFPGELILRREIVSKSECPATERGNDKSKQSPCQARQSSAVQCSAFFPS